MHHRSHHHLRMLIAALLIVALIGTSVPTSAFATNAPTTASALARQKGFPKPGKAPVELEDRRTANSKEYLNPDGSFTVVSYAEPVHYKDKNDRFVDIDNQLVASEDALFQYRNKANSFQASFANGAKTGDLVRIAKDANHWLAFSPEKPAQRTGQLTSSSQDKSQFMKYGLDQNTELRYSVGSNRLKEEIVLTQYPGTNAFSFTLQMKGLTYELGEDGLYHFLDEKGQGLFFLEQPYAVDANEDITTNAKLSIVPGQGKDRLTVTVDDKWLRNAAYPVVIDPSVIDETNSAANCSDTIVSSSNPTSNYYTAAFLSAGTHPATYGATRAYVRWDVLPNLPVGASIDKVELRLNMYMSFPDSTTVSVSPITGSWSLSALNWNNQPGAGSVISSLSGNTQGYWDFDITQIASKWYGGTAANNGVRLTAAPESANRRSFRSSNYSSNRPALRITYTLEPTGIQSFWGYAGNTNVLNGNLVVSATDVTLPGRGIPISISRTYNSRSAQDSSFGYGWSNNIAMNLTWADEGVVKLVDGTGSAYHFVRQSDGSYRAPVGIHYELRKESGVFTLQDPSGTKHFFDANGRLDKVVDPQDRTTDIVTDSDGLVTHVVDASKRYAHFIYSGDPVKRLQSIKLNTTPGAYPNSQATETAASYTYDTNGNLATVTKVNDGQNVVISFGYANHDLTSITDPLGKVTSVGYSDDRVATITKTLSAASGILDKAGYGNVNSSTAGVGSVTTSFGYQPRVQATEKYAMNTTVTDPRGNRTVYRSNDQGNVEQVEKYLSTGNELYEMAWDEMQNLLSIKDPKGNSTVMSYDGKGNVLSTRNPDGAGAIYHYNADGDMVSSTDFAGRSTVQSYDDKRQVVAVTNQQYATSATDRDGNGNVESEASPLTLAENLLPNGGFELRDGTDPAGGWSGSLTPTPGSVSDDTLTKVNGLHSVKVVGLATEGQGYGRLLSFLYTPVQASGRYVASWSVKTDALGTEGAGLIIHWYNSSKTWIGWTDVMQPVSGTSDWAKQVAFADAPANAVYARPEFRLKSPGTAWVDNVQLERGSAINGINLLNNEGFEVNLDADPRLPDGWWSDTLVGTDGVSTAESHLGGKSVLVNATTSGKNFGLGVDTSGENIAGVAGTAVTFSGWIKTANMTGLAAQLRLKVTYADGSLGWFDAPSTSGSHDWQYVENTIVVPKNFKRWSLYGWLGSGAGQAWYDDFSLHIYGTSSALASDFNMFSNGSFELDIDGNSWPDDLVKETATTAGTYDVTWASSSSSFKAYAGSKAIRIQNVPGWVTLGNGSWEMLEGKSGVTGQAMVKTVNVTKGGAAAKFEVFNGSTKLGQYLSDSLTGSKDWTKLSLSYSTAEITQAYPTADRVRFLVGAVGATIGTMYFDGLRMSEQATKTAYTYDNAGNYLKTITNPLGNTVSFTNDAHGNVLTVRDPKGNTATFTYDDLDRLQTAKNASNLLTEYGYDKNGNLLTVTQKDGVSLNSLGVNTSVFNELGLVTKVIDPLNRITEYRYDQNGNLAYVKTASGQEAWFIYNEQDRLTNVQYLQEGTGHLLVFTYDKNGNRLSVEHKTGSLANPSGMTTRAQYSYAYAYDSQNRVTTITPPVGRPINYTYNQVGQVTSIDNSGVNMLTYSYDYTGLNTSISDTVAGDISFLYDEVGRVTKSATSNGLTTLVEYNDLGQVISQKMVSAAQALLALHSYEYDQNGNRTKDTTLDGSYVQYEYDSVNELLSEKYYTAQGALSKTLAYTYDKKGNRLTKKVTVGGSTTTTTYSYNAANEMTAINGVSVSSLDGNQLNTGDNRLVYNTLGQVIQLQSASGQLLEQYEYNADGLRTAKLDASGAVIEKYVYNGSKLAYVYRGSKLLYYFTRSSSGALISMVDCTGSAPVPYWYVKDAHGNVSGLVDVTGNSVASYSYDAWGNELSSSGSVMLGDGSQTLKDANPFRYSSYFFDQTSGLYYLNARYYSPKLGRFLSQDPVANGPNQYTYCGNDPVLLVDSEGTFPGFDAILAFAGGGAAAGLSIGGAAALAVTGLGLVLLGAGLVGYVVSQIRDSRVDQVRVSSDAGNTSTHYPNSSVQGPPPPPKKPKWEKQRDEHIFKEKHNLENSPGSRQLIEETVGNPENYIGQDIFGDQWFVRLLPIGQVWAKLGSSGVVKSAGVNTMKWIWDYINGRGLIRP